MRIVPAALALAAALVLGACRSDEPPARQAGKTAYQLSQESKEAARKAGRELRKAGKELREGWNEAKHEDRATRPEKPTERRP
jgi:hypothetical protein